MEAQTETLSNPRRARWGFARPRTDADADRASARDYWVLVKPEISFLVTVSALAGFLLGSPGAIRGATLLLTLAGTALSAAGSGVLNHYAERRHDALMRRTASRPLPAGRVAPQAALIYGLALVVLGLGVLWFTNLLTATLAALTVVLYLLVYTPLKRHTLYNTLVGTIPGALPALGGYAAATGRLGTAGWALFAILVLWQMPHFLSLAWMYRKDYARANYRMLPVVCPDGNATVRQTLGFAVALVIASALPTVLGSTGWLYLAGALVLGAWFMTPAYAFYRSKSTRDARRVLMVSIAYIPLLVVVICADRWVQ